MQVRLSALLTSVFIVAAACGSAQAMEATGVVVEFDGDITSVTQFVVRVGPGEDLVFYPADDLVFHDAPVGHIGEHWRSGVPVTVRYTVDDTGRLIAEEIFDAG